MQNGYYLGLDIGTDSVGYAVTDQEYNLKKYKGEPMWGVHLFEGGKDAAERRAHRTYRRRIDRVQQRVDLVGELFAEEIGKIDPDFFIRRKESALFAEDTKHGVKIFRGNGITDKEYHLRYPTIHHLILDLMTSDQPHDIRLVYMACAWLVAHRGHFLFDFAPDQTEKLLDFDKTFEEFLDYFSQDVARPWSAEIKAGDLLSILSMQTGVSKKKDAFKQKIYGGKKVSKEATEEFPYSCDAIMTLLCGGKVKPEALFTDPSMADIDSVSLLMGDEDFDRIVSELGDNGELLCKMRAMQNCARLITTMSNKRPQDPTCISSSKIAIYEQHKKDLEALKRFVRKYCKNQYAKIFRLVESGNYVAYSKNLKSVADPKKFKSANKEVFSDFLLKIVKNIKVRKEDAAMYTDMVERLEARTFLPKQKDGDNRVIPQQLYRQEMAAILAKAEKYIPMLSKPDADGMTVTQKLLSIFDFRIPYYVGPLVRHPQGTAWIERKQGRILPWNFEEMVDLDASEQGFIKKMTNDCTYLPGQKVLPVNSLLYGKFTVLNELNNLKVDGVSIPVKVKQELYESLFMQKPRVTVKQIRDHLLTHGYMTVGSELTGIDTTFKAGLKSYHVFRNLLESGVLNEAEVESIIEHAAYTEDKSRMRHWLKQTFPQIPEGDVAYILKQDLKQFGRLSPMLLAGLYGSAKNSDGEAFTIIEALWNTNENLMQLLSDRYTFSEQIREYTKEYYAEHPASLTRRLEDMYISGPVKRPIFRTLDIISDVVKATGKAPEKIFIEMARGGTEDQKGKRTKSRKDQLLDLYKLIKTEDARIFEKELKNMGETADNRLQERKLFLYYLQMGKCAYTGEPIDVNKLGSGDYNLDHIYPQSYVKDDSLFNNLVLVKSEANGIKGDSYPVPEQFRNTMYQTWQYWKDKGLMTDEKFSRLTRKVPFSDHEKQGFINRQLVETRQSTKAIATLLKERFPDTAIVYVKAGMVSEFRQEFDLPKSRTVNDLHHAKDAYLNVVVGNVYHERFSDRWFRIDEHYNVQLKKIFDRAQRHGSTIYWNGEADIAKVKKTAGKNAIHMTRYAFLRKGGLFDQQPVRKAKGLVSLKHGMATEKYGGYNKPSVCGYVLAKYTAEGKTEIMFVPVDLRMKDQATQNIEALATYTIHEIGKITNQEPEKVELLLDGRMLKINTAIMADGVRMALAGKDSGGANVLLSPVMALTLSKKWEAYIKALESFDKKRTVNRNIVLNQDHDGISAPDNLELYRLLIQKMKAWPFCNYPGNQVEVIETGEKIFTKAAIADQVTCLLNILQLMGPGSGGIDLSVCGGKKSVGSKRRSAKLSNWKKYYKEVRIVDVSASGLYEKISENLLEML